MIFPTMLTSLLSTPNWIKSSVLELFNTIPSRDSKLGSKNIFTGGRSAPDISTSVKRIQNTFFSRGMFLTPHSLINAQSLIQGLNQTKTISDIVHHSLNFFNGQHYSVIELLNTIFNFFFNILESEICIKRIACQMAVTKKTSIIPSLIYW